MGKYIKIARPNMGSYIEPINNIKYVLDAEFGDYPEYAVVGDKTILEVIEMDDEEYAKLPEFTGW
jgi:hypothetical protein